MASNKLFDEHERARAAAEAASRKYAEFLKGSSKAQEPDDEGTRSKQIGRVRRDARKGK
jgi:hypothetical protein